MSKRYPLSKSTVQAAVAQYVSEFQRVFFDQKAHAIVEPSGNESELARQGGADAKRARDVGMASLPTTPFVVLRSGPTHDASDGASARRGIIDSLRRELAALHPAMLSPERAPQTVMNTLYGVSDKITEALVSDPELGPYFDAEAAKALDPA